MSEEIKILVIGCGSIGKRHIRNLLTLGYKNIYACRVVSKRYQEIEEEFRIKCYTKIDKALALKPDISFICTPTSQHLPYAIKALRAGAHIFLEKPISDSLRGVNTLLKLARSKRKIIFVGYPFRFHPIIVRIKDILKSQKYGKPVTFHISMGNYLPNWHPWEDYRISYAGIKALGGGVALTLSHEIDYAQHFFGKIEYVAAFLRHAGTLQIYTEDNADILLKHKNNVTGSIHLDYLQSPVRQVGYIVLEKGRIEWDLRDNYLKIYSGSKDRPHIRYYKGYNLNRMYVEEVKYFLRLIKKNHIFYANFQESLHTLQVVVAAMSSARQNRIVAVR